MPNFAPAGSFAAQFGVKAVCYGPPGSGKTPLINTAPRPVMLATEPGLLSMRGSSVSTCMARTGAEIEDFFKWLSNSAEARNFDTVAIDSGSQLAEIILDEELSRKSKSGNKVDGKAAYGEMSRRALAYFEQLFYTMEKHVYIVCKEERNDGIRRPYFPGKDLNVKIPHKYDEILHLDRTYINGVGEVPALRTTGTGDIVARDRSGKLALFEMPNLTALFSKITT